jgi:hypothetical protein
MLKTDKFVRLHDIKKNAHRTPPCRKWRPDNDAAARGIQKHEHLIKFLHPRE